MIIFLRAALLPARTMILSILMPRPKTAYFDVKICHYDIFVIFSTDKMTIMDILTHFLLFFSG